MKPGSRQFRILVFLPLLFGIVMVTWKHEALLQRVNGRLAEAHLAKAIRSAEAGEWKKSEQLSLAAWQLKEGCPEILRQLFRSARELRSRHLLYAAGALFDHPEATAEDRIEVIRLHFQIGDLVGTKRLLSALDPHEVVSPEAMDIAVRFLLARGDILRALALVEKLQQERGNREDTLLAAQVLVRIPTESNKAISRAQSMIAELFYQEEDRGIAVAALSLLRTIPQELWETERFPGVDERLRELHPSGDSLPITLRFLAADFEIAAHPENREDRIDHLVSRTSEAELAPLTEWLLSLQELELAEKLLTDELAASAPDLYLGRARILLASGRWEEAQEFLSLPHPQLSPVVVHAMRAVAAAEGGKPASSREQWERALRQAILLSGRHSLLELARLASAAGAEDVRNRALVEALKRPSVAPLPSSDVRFLFSHLVSEEDPDNLLAISRSLLRSEPENPLLLNNVAWLELIMNQSSGDIDSSRIRELAEEFPGIPTLRATLALALFEEERTTEAAAIAASMKDSPAESLSATDHAVITLVHGKTEEPVTTPSRDGIDWSGMMEIERSYFRTALASVDSSRP